jgi:hypothetical protein
LATVQPRDCYVADRNFCTTEFLFGIVDRNAYFLIRQHASTLNGKRLLGDRRFAGTCEAGRIYEQNLEIDNPQTGKTMVVRRVTLELDVPTRNGEREVHLLTNVPRRLMDAAQVATVYRGRWTIENAFQELGQALCSEINTLCYPKAALLCFCIGVTLYNTFSLLKRAIEAAHPQTPALSGYYLAEEVSAVYSGMMIAIAPRIWTRTFAALTPRQLAKTLCSIAKHVNPTRFRKSVRGPKKRPPPRTGGTLREKHVSTARILSSRLK